MAEKFADFDNYQLAKYNKAGKSKKKVSTTRWLRVRGYVEQGASFRMTGVKQCRTASERHGLNGKL